MLLPFSLYKRLDLNKMTPTEISLQMDDKTTAVPIGICEDVPVVVANVMILTDFVILEMSEDDNMSIILGTPFLNTARAVIDCNKSNVTFHVNGNEHTIYFPIKINKGYGLNSIEEIMTITIGGFEFPILVTEKEYQTIMIGTMPIQVEVT